MVARPLVIAVYDPKWFMSVLDRLKRRGVRHHHYYSPSELPLYPVVYTDSQEIADEVKASRDDAMVMLDPSRTCEGLERAILASLGKQAYDKVVIGVDTGAGSAFVVLADSTLADWGWHPGSLVEKIGEIATCLPSKEVVVRIGANERGLELAHELKRTFSSFRVELVSEQSTSPSHDRLERLRLVDEQILEVLRRAGRRKDLLAALSIAMREGVEVI